jgi:hypothetical protein
MSVCVMCLVYTNCVHRCASVHLVYSSTVVQYILQINLYIYKVGACVCQVCELAITISKVNTDHTFSTRLQSQILSVKSLCTTLGKFTIMAQSIESICVFCLFILSGSALKISYCRLNLQLRLFSLNT